VLTEVALLRRISDEASLGIPAVTQRGRAQSRRVRGVTIGVRPAPERAEQLRRLLECHRVLQRDDCRAAGARTGRFAPDVLRRLPRPLRWPVHKVPIRQQPEHAGARVDSFREPREHALHPAQPRANERTVVTVHPEIVHHSNPEQRKRTDDLRRV
jgi:hypothetical protein